MLKWVQSCLPPCSQTINVYGTWVSVWVQGSWNSSLLVLLGSARIVPRLWDWVPGQEVQAQHILLSPSAPAICLGRGALLSSRQLATALAAFGLAGGHCALMHAVWSHATSVKVTRQITADSAAQMGCSIKAWVLPLRASTRSPWACPLQCRGPKDLYLKPNLP